VQTLQTYPFPANVRELGRLERALTLSTGGVITAEHIRCAATRLPPRPSARAAGRGGGNTALGASWKASSATPLSRHSKRPLNKRRGEALE